MLKFKRFSMFSLISAVLLFLMILPALAMEGESGSCTVSSDGVETCISDPISETGVGSEPGNPGEESVDPTPVDPVEEVPVVEEKPVEEVPVVEEKPVEEVPVVEEKPVEEAPVVEEKPVEEAPDAVVDEEDNVVPEDWIKRTDTDEEAIEDDGIRYFITSDLAAGAPELGINATNVVAGLSVMATLGGSIWFAFRSKKK